MADFITFEDRPSDSPFVERVWRCRSERGGGAFLSMAESNLELVVSRLPGLLMVTLRGPVTRASMIDCPVQGEWFAIRFRPGTYFRRLPTGSLLDHRDLDLPTVGPRYFWLGGHVWEIPDFDTAETFVARLARRGIIARDDAVTAVIGGDHQPLCKRSVQRHFLHSIGMTHGQYLQIGRARKAAGMLQGGCSILDVVHDAGYFDQAHLTRSVSRLIGLTPAKILRNEMQLSFSYKAEAE